MEKRQKDHCLFHISEIFFFNLATLTKHCILHIESYLFIFQATVFFGKTYTTNQPKIRSRKIIEKIDQLGPKMTPNLIEIDMENPKNLGNRPKN